MKQQGGWVQVWGVEWTFFQGKGYILQNLIVLKKTRKVMFKSESSV